MNKRSTESGFTLIELLVALLIFALLAAAGVILLRGSIDTQATVARNLDALADVQRGIATLDADLSQAVPRISRLREGTSAPAFFGRKAQQGEPILQFVRTGWSNPAGQRHSSLQRLEYRWRDGRIERIGYEVVDGGETPEPAILFDHVTDLSLRYRAAKGDWLDVWAPSNPALLPVAIEMTVTRGTEPPLTLSFLVGAAVGQQDQQQAPSADGPDPESLLNGV